MSDLNAENPSNGEPAEVWPPTPLHPDAILPPSEPGPFVNNSGTNGPIPPEIAKLKWNWGAFVVTPFWLGYHGMRFFGCLLFLVVGCIRLASKVSESYALFGFLTLAVNIYCGLVGHKLAWRRRRYESLEQYIEVESIWRNWAIGFLVLALVRQILVSLPH